MSVTMRAMRATHGMRRRVRAAKAMSDSGIAVMGHVGLTPQVSAVDSAVTADRPARA